MLSEAKTGYTWNFQLYTGKDDTRKDDTPLSTHVVMELTQELQGKGYHVYMDNFYASPGLCKYFYAKGFGSCGTLRLDRKGVPKWFRTATVIKGEVLTYNDAPVMGLKWHDKCVVSLLTTIHDDSMISKSRWKKGGDQQVVQKPSCIDEYNSYMGGVDMAAQLLQYYGCKIIYKKWWKCVFFHMLDVTLVNAYILYYKTAVGKPMSHLDFLISVARGLVTAGEAEIPDSASSVLGCPMRLMGHNHFPEPAGGMPDCVVCSNRHSGKRKRTSYRCCSCKVALCVHPCFGKYHTLKTISYERRINSHICIAFDIQFMMLKTS